MTAGVRLTMFGKRFGARTVISEPFKHGTRHCVVARCGCGRDDIVRLAHLRAGKALSCLRCSNSSHGHTAGGKRSRTFRSWESMKRRCTDPDGNRWEHYGGRGIAFDPRWERFDAFLADMGAATTEKHTLDRIDVDGNYEKANCRWATVAEQNANKRGPSASVGDHDWAGGDF